MPGVNEIIELLEAISQTGESTINLCELVNLLKKVSITTVKKHIDLDYDGREWHWKMGIQDITASEYIARERKHQHDKANV